MIGFPKSFGWGCPNVIGFPKSFGWGCPSMIGFLKNPSHFENFPELNPWMKSVPPKSQSNHPANLFAENVIGNSKTPSQK